MEGATWTWVPVRVQLGHRWLGSFLFAYTHGVAVQRFEPRDTVPPTGPDAPNSLLVAVHGTAFLPARDASLRCRTGHEPSSYTVVEATYTRNGTVECPVPAAALEGAWLGREPGATEALLVIEVSLNGGQQYTQDGLGLVVRAPERLREPAGPQGEPPVSPSFSYTAGGTLLTVHYEQAYAPASPRAACLFQFRASGTGVVRTLPTPVIAVDEDASTVQCYAPPA
jgi:hypothetical protein